MESILLLFGSVSEFLASVSLLLPVISSVIIKAKKISLKPEMRLFEAFIYLTFISQITSHNSLLGLNQYKDIILSFYLPIHTFFLSYLLIKWSSISKNGFLLAGGITIITLILNFVLSEYNLPVDKMFWFDTFVLLVLSVFLSVIRDKKNINLECEKNFIHNGIYISSLLTILGITLPQLDVLFFGLFIHSIANITCNIYFARSFLCLSR